MSMILCCSNSDAVVFWKWKKYQNLASQLELHTNNLLKGKGHVIIFTLFLKINIILYFCTLFNKYGMYYAGMVFFSTRQLCLRTPLVLHLPFSNSSMFNLTCFKLVTQRYFYGLDR